MIQDYSKFYLYMLYGLTFFIGFFSSMEFGFLSLEFIMMCFFWIIGITLAMSYKSEVHKLTQRGKK